MKKFCKKATLCVDLDNAANQKELTEYDDAKKPHQKIEDHEFTQTELMNTLNSEFICPICLDLMKNTMVTECLHRFCSECITNAIYKSNRECPKCRKKLVSKRNLRLDPNFDKLIDSIWPDRNVYDELQGAQARMCQTNNAALQKSIQAGMKEQAAAMRRQQCSPTENIDEKSSSGQKENVAPPQQRGRGRPSKGATNATTTTTLTSPDSGVGTDILEERREEEEEDATAYGVVEMGKITLSDFGSSSEDDEHSSDESSSSTDGLSDSDEENGGDDFDSSTTTSNNDGEEWDDDFASPPRKKVAVSWTGESTSNFVSPPKSIPLDLSTLLLTKCPSRNIVAIDNLMKEYGRQNNKPLGIVTVQLKPLPVEMGGKRDRMLQNAQTYRITLSHMATIGELHSKFTKPEFHPLNMCPNMDGKLPEMHLFIQGAPSKRMVELHHADTICTVLGLAFRENFLHYPVIYFTN